MKKVLLVLAVLTALVMTGCQNTGYISNDVPQNETNQEQKSVDNQENTELESNRITREYLEKFLSLMVCDEYDNIEEITDTNLSNDNYATFIRIIRILLRTNQYEKNDDTYYFSLEKIKEFAENYFDEHDFYYDASDNVNFAFNEETNKYESSLSFGLYENFGISKRELSVENFSMDNDSINVECSVTTNYQVDNAIIEKNYLIVIEVKDDNFAIKSINVK